MFLFFAGCSSNKKVEKKFDNQAEKLVQALETKDSELFKSLLSNNALNTEDLDAGIDYCFDLIGDKQFMVKKLGCPIYDEFDSGKHKKWIEASYLINVTEKETYFLDFSFWIVNDCDKNTLGINNLKISEYTLGNYISAIEYEKNGIYNPEWDME